MRQQPKPGWGHAPNRVLFFCGPCFRWGRTAECNFRGLPIVWAWPYFLGGGRVALFPAVCFPSGFAAACKEGRVVFLFWLAFIELAMAVATGYLPMQKREKIMSRTSSVVVSPTMSPR